MKDEIIKLIDKYIKEVHWGDKIPEHFIEWLNKQELPKQEGRDVSKGEIEKAKTTAKANKLIKMFDDAIEGRLIKFQPKSDISEEEVEGKLSISAVRDLFNEGYDYLTIYTKEEFDKWLDAKLFQSDKPEVKP